jgi:DNA primase
MNASSYQIPREFVDEIRERSDIVEVISECGVPLRAAGKDYKANCPFHDEKTPSFSVSPQKQIFYCFGCQTGGNVISFVQKHEGKSFVESIEWLASRLGMALPNQDAKADQARRKRLELQDLNRFAAEYFHKQLLTPEVGGRALAYLKNRGVNDATIQQSQLGYTTPGRRDLVKAATQAGFSIQQLVDVGLIKNDDHGPVDRFRGRIIFPILDERGIPVGFGGRALADDLLPKYLNSPATTIYDKSKTLYNLYPARSEIQKTGTALLVEGYLDALILYQAGIKNVVASLGTALSTSHASLLKRFSEEVVIVYDGDAAGFQATLRGLHLLVKEALRVRIALLPPDQDPDSFVRSKGVDKFNDEIEKAINLIEFQIQRAVRQDALRNVEVKAQAVKEISLTLSNVESQVQLNEYVKFTAHELDINENALWRELRSKGVGTKAKHTSSPHQDSPPSPDEARLSPREDIEEQLVETLIQSPDFVPYVKDQLHYQDFTQPDLARVVQMLWEASAPETSIDIQDLINCCNDEKTKGIISNAILRKPPPPNSKAKVDGCLQKFRQFLVLDMERMIRSNALTQGDDNIDTLEQLIALSNQRRQFVP